MSKEINTLFLTRGVPGTHDTQMLFQCIKKLKNGKFKKLTIPKFDKSIDDRLSKKMVKSSKNQISLFLKDGVLVLRHKKIKI